jgi:hypothetical protein
VAVGRHLSKQVQQHVAWQLNSHIICHQLIRLDASGLSLLKEREFVEIVVLYWLVNVLKKIRSRDWIKSKVLGTIESHAWKVTMGNFKMIGSLPTPRSNPKVKYFDCLY